MSTPVDPAAPPTTTPPPITPPVAPEPPPGSATASVPPPAPASNLPEDEPLTPELLEDEAIRGDFVLRWLVVVTAFLFGLTQIADSATLIHVKTGQYLLSHGILPPRTDVFSYTAADRPWINLAWGFDLLLAGLYAVGGWVAVSLIKPVLAAVAFGLAVHTTKPRMPTWWTAVCIAAAIVACHKQFLSQPYIVTFVGLGITMWLLERWRNGLSSSDPSAAKGPPQSLWPLVAVFLVWSNFDPRMFLGLALLVLWGIGDLLASLFGIETAVATEHRGHFWKVVAASVAASLVHPFLWNTLLSPLHLYGADYAGHRSYLEALAPAMGADVLTQPGSIPYFPLPEVPIGSYDLAAWCGVGLLAVAFVSIALNYFREIGHLVALAGFVGIAVAAMHDLPAAAFVAAVVAALNGQAWFVSSFKLDYNVGLWNVAYSRGGRAATVLAMAALAFFGGTGRLRSALTGRTGVGLDYGLASTMTGLQSQLADSFDDQPFNTSLQQGDILVWLGQKVFADNRAAVYYGPGDKNLLVTQVATRFALAGRTLAPPAEAGGAPPPRPNWRTVFDEYKLTHVVPRLSGASPDYGLTVELIKDGRNWQATSFGGATLVLYRTDLKDPGLKTYLESHTVDFIKQAYQTKTTPVEPRFDSWARGPSFYERYFWSRRRQVPIEIQEALHLVRLAPLSPHMGDAMAFLGIRKAQQGLNKDPNSAEGYLALGMGYLTLLNQWEGPQLPIESHRVPHSIRYHQALAAFHQALIADPDNHEPRVHLVDLYQGPIYRQVQQQRGEAPPDAALRPDLVLRELRALQGVLLSNAEPSPEEREFRTTTDQKIQEYQEYLDTVVDKLAHIKTDSPQERMQLVMNYAGAGCFDAALKVIESDPDPGANPDLRRLRPEIMFECGQIGEAFELLRDYEVPEMPGAAGFARLTAISKATAADCVFAAKIASGAARVHERMAASELLNSLKLQPASDQPWPIPPINGAGRFFFTERASMGDLWLIAAQFELEAGRLDEATENFRKVLEIHPDAPTSVRQLIGHFLTRLTGNLEYEPVPQRDQIPIVHEDWPVEP